MDALVETSIGIEEIIALGRSIKSGKIRIKEVTRDVDEEAGDFEENVRREKTLALIDRVTSLYDQIKRLREFLKIEGDEKKKDRVTEKIKKNKREILDLLKQVRFEKRQMENIIDKVRDLAERTENERIMSEQDNSFVAPPTKFKYKMGKPKLHPRPAMREFPGVYIWCPERQQRRHVSLCKTCKRRKTCFKDSGLTNK
jgi:hypothetical protein